MTTRNVVRSQHQHDLAESLVKSGRYHNASEVIRDGLRVLERQEAENMAKLAALRDAADRGWSNLASGRFDDVADDALDDFIGQLGLRALRTRQAGQWRVIASPTPPRLTSFRFSRGGARTDTSS